MPLVRIGLIYRLKKMTWMIIYFFYFFFCLKIESSNASFVLYGKVAFLTCNSGPDVMGSSAHWTGQKLSLYLPAAWVSVGSLHVICFLVATVVPVSTLDPLCSKTTKTQHKCHLHFSDFVIQSKIDWIMSTVQK